MPIHAHPLLRPVALLAMVLAAGLALPPTALAQRDGDEAGGEQGGGRGILALLPPRAVTHHTVRVNDTRAGRPAQGIPLAYTAEAGTLPLRGGDGATMAGLFYVAYTLDPEGAGGPTAPTGNGQEGSRGNQGATVPARHERPVTFVFNGGPGAASAYLHLGGLGPRIVQMRPDGTPTPPPARLIDNPDTWLAFTDLVFVDPPGTGYSRGADAKQESALWGVEADQSAMAAFIRLYLERSGRMTSPVFLAGESYGGYRAALLARTLQGESGIQPSGAVLISPALEFSLLFGDDDVQILPTALSLPSMAAAALERQGVHGRQALATRLLDAERFALGDYLAMLAAGPVAAGERATPTVARLTGLSPDLVRQGFGRVSASRFIKETGRATGQVLSRYDATVGGPDIDPASSSPRGPDPVLDGVTPPLTSAFVDYVRGELGYRTDVTYRLLNREIAGKWDYGTSPSNQGYAGVLDDLQRARALNPHLQVLVANGYTDLVTPYLMSRYLIGTLPPLAGADPVRLQVYEGGHMMYLRPDSRAALRQEVEGLVEAGAN